MASDLMVPYRLRTVRVGVDSTYLVLAVLAALPLLPAGGQLDGRAFAAVLGVALIGAFTVSLLPWQRMFERGWGMRAMYAWSVLDIVLISLLLVLGGPDAGEVFWVYTLTTIFFAASYPWRGQVVLLAFTFASYLGTEALAGWSGGTATIVMRLGVLGSIAFMAMFLSRELRGQMVAHERARLDADQRAELLGKVAQAGRAINSLDPRFALQAVVDASVALGFDAATVNVLNAEEGTYRPVSVRGLPLEYADRAHPSDGGMVGAVRRHGRTVVVDDYEALEGTPPELHGKGFRHVIGTPIWLDNDIAAVLIVGTTRSPRALARQEIEAFELLAAEAGAALTNARRYEAERHTAERLEELDRLKTDFLTTISHELRTPLTLVSGGAQVLRERGDSLAPEQRAELLEAIDTNSRRLSALLLTVLDFTRLQSDDLNPRLQPMELPSLVEAVLARQRGLNPDRDLRADVPEAATVTADGGLLDRVLDHLVANAVQHTPPGTTVTVRAVPEEHEVVLEVRDNGPGFEAGDLPHLGERFYRGGGQGGPDSSGMGLGLALARRVLALHGSALVLSNAPEGGAVVSFRLPLRSATTPSLS